MSETQAIYRKENIFDIEQDLLVLFNRIVAMQESCEEPSSELWAEFDEQMEKSQDKRDSVARFLLFVESQETMLKREADLIEAKRHKIEAAKEDFKTRIAAMMKAWGLVELEGHAHSLKIVKNGGSQPVEIVNVSVIPDNFMEHPDPPPARPNKEMIRRCIEQGMDIPGARLGARGERLVIR